MVNSLLGHYRILKKIGAGGMGEVFLGEDARLDRKVAVKFLHEELSRDADKLNRFIQEAKSVSALNHPNILTVYEISEFEGTHFIATEFIDGSTLSEYAKSNSFDFNALLEIAIQIASALVERQGKSVIIYLDQEGKGNGIWL